MTEPFFEEKTNEVARRSKRATLASLISGAVFYVILFVSLNVVIRSETLPDWLKVMAMITVTLGVLFYGLALIGDLFARKNHWQWDTPLLTLLWVFILPTVYFLCMCMAYTISATNFWTTLSGFGLIVTNQVPTLFFWQGIMLTWFMLRVKKPDPFRVFSLKLEETWIGCLSGVGLALTAIFLISIQSSLIPSIQGLNAGFPFSAQYLRWVLLVFAVSLLPWAEEQYFRGTLYEWFGLRLGNAGGLVISSILFALLPFRINLFLPALILGFGFGFLRERTRLEVSIVAHMFCNVIILGLFNAYMF
jgi:membrane protease YdiL (CAAX protease family)